MIESGLRFAAIDIGSNDGSMLSALKKQKLQVLGIEPEKKISEYIFSNKEYACS